MTLKTGNKIAFFVYFVEFEPVNVYLPKFDVVNGVGIDHLHNTLLGVIKMLIRIWYVGKNLMIKYKIFDYQILSVEFQEL